MEQNENQNQEPLIKEKPLAELKKRQISELDALDSYKKVRHKRKQKAIMRAFVWALVIFMTPIFVFSLVIISNPRAGHNFFGYTFYVVSSESMKGVFDVNDCVVIKKINSRKDVQVGDDISFVRASDGQIVTHRIVSTKLNDYGEIVYVTKGVHNLTADPSPVSYNDIIGKRVAVLSVLGNAIMFFRTPYGIVTFIMILVLLAILFSWLYRRSNDIRSVGLS